MAATGSGMRFEVVERRCWHRSVMAGCCWDEDIMVLRRWRVFVVYYMGHFPALVPSCSFLCTAVYGTYLGTI